MYFGWFKDLGDLMSLHLMFHKVIDIKCMHLYLVNQTLNILF